MFLLFAEFLNTFFINFSSPCKNPYRDKAETDGRKVGDWNILDTKWSRKDGYEVEESRIILCVTLFRHSFNKPSTNFQFVCAITDGERLESLGCRMVLPRFLASWMYFWIGGENGQTQKKVQVRLLGQEKSVNLCL